VLALTNMKPELIRVSKLRYRDASRNTRRDIADHLAISSLCSTKGEYACSVVLRDSTSTACDDRERQSMTVQECLLTVLPTCGAVGTRYHLVQFDGSSHRFKRLANH